jgi:hypothetical protein
MMEKSVKLAGMDTILPDSPTPGLPSLDPVQVLSALGNALRWQMFQMMLEGQEVTLAEVIALQKRGYNAVHKDMDVLCNAGVVTWRFGEDRRVGLFFIPAVFRPQPGLVDFGFTRFGTARVSLAKD